MQKKILILGFCFMVFGSTLDAQITKEDKKKAKALFSGKVYMRIDAPSKKGRHPYGIYYSPLVDVSPTGTNTESDEGLSVGWYHAESTVWKVRVNDLMELDELDWEVDEGTVEIQLEGAGNSEGRDTAIRFVNIWSFADFEAAFARTFSTQPLQNEHPDWPEDIKSAIASRQLVTGMNKRQTYYVVGAPEKVEKTTEGEKAVEIWTLRTQGPEVGYFTFRTGGDPGNPKTLRFEDGLLVSADVGVTPEGLDLDN